MANVLLIEPDAVLGKTYRQALEHAGHLVAVAQAAQPALNAAEDFGPDIVVLELQLATHNGVEFLHEFRSYSEWQDVPVIVHTNTAPHLLALVGEALRRDLGARAVLYKPRTSLRQLIRTVSDCLRVSAEQKSDQGPEGEGVRI